MAENAIPPRWLGPLVIALSAAALAAITWRCWPDVLVDFGREAYAAWRLSEGDQLYRDIAWFHGPLSPYWNALWFHLFGAFLTTLFAVNLTLLALFLTLIYGMVLKMSDALTALVADLVVLALFAFPQIARVGNYNFVAPYSHEATHGLMCGLASVAFIGSWARTGTPGGLLLAGLFSGLAMLTKAEMALAGLCGPLSGLVLAYRFVGPVGFLRAVLLFSVSALSVLLMAFLALALYSDMDTACEALTAPWRGLGALEIMALPFYQVGMGFNDVPGQLAAAGLWTARWVAALAPAMVLAFIARPGSNRTIAPFWIGVMYVYALCLTVVWADWNWLQAMLPLPLVTVAVAVTALATSRQAGLKSVPPFALAVFALTLLGKMLLNAHLYHYGFVLALPATLLLVITVAHWIPLWVGQRGGHTGLVRATSLALMLAPCAIYAGVSLQRQSQKGETVASDGDQFRSDQRGAYVQRALDKLSEAPAGKTLAVLPDGAMLNYLTRRRNPTPNLNFMPPLMLMYGERSMLEAFEANPPDLIALVHMDTTEYGPQFFGQDYGRGLMGWIVKNYQLETLIGEPPFAPSSTFGIAILDRKSGR